MKTYPKMQTLFMRNVNTHKIIPDSFSRAEFGNVSKWIFTEKIDGMNIRVEYDNSDMCYGHGRWFSGRTGKSALPNDMFLYLERGFPFSLLEEVFPWAKNVVLFGEGYGGKIQKSGSLYREDTAFILFDVYMDGRWLERKSVEHIAYELNCKCVPVLPFDTIEEGIEYVLSKPQSLIAETPKMAEGIVAKSDPVMLFRNGNMIAWKLKVQDFINLGIIEDIVSQIMEVKE